MFAVLLDIPARPEIGGYLDSFSDDGVADLRAAANTHTRHKDRIRNDRTLFNAHP